MRRSASTRSAIVARGIGIERCRVVQQFAAAERAEAGVQVIEPARDEFQRQNFFAVDVA